MGARSKPEAFFLAPLVFIGCFLVIVVVEEIGRRITGTLPTSFDPTPAELYLLGAVLAVPLLYLGTLVLGVPIVWWLEKTGHTNFRHFMGAGTLLATGLAMLGGVALGEAEYEDHLFTALVTGLYVGIPTIAAFVFAWRYRHRRRRGG